MRLFAYIDQALVDAENRPAYTAREPRVWPSEASAVLFDQRKDPIVGKCHRASFFRLIGKPVERRTDAVGARKFRLGKACEVDVVNLAKDAGIHVASGVKCMSKTLMLPFELDLVVGDPETWQGYIVENKSFAGYYKTSELKKGKPSIENVVQALLYLNEIKTGAELKRVVAAALVKQAGQTDPEKKARLKVTEDNLAKLSDGPLKCKLAYEDRAEGVTFEFDVALWEDEFDGLHYAEVDGEPWQLFTVESIYERFRILQDYWIKARAAAVQRLAGQKVFEPAEDAFDFVRQSWDDALGEAMRTLPTTFWPPAEYEFQYSHEKILSLFQEGLLSKSLYEEYMMVFQRRNRKPRPLPVVGAWQCRFCSYQMSCLSEQDSAFGLVAQDLMALEPIDSEAA